jgi:hypothetical protein
MTPQLSRCGGAGGTRTPDRGRRHPTVGHSVRFEHRQLAEGRLTHGGANCASLTTGGETCSRPRLSDRAPRHPNHGQSRMIFKLSFVRPDPCPVTPVSHNWGQCILPGGRTPPPTMPNTTRKKPSPITRLSSRCPGAEAAGRAPARIDGICDRSRPRDHPSVCAGNDGSRFGTTLTSDPLLRDRPSIFVTPHAVKHARPYVGHRRTGADPLRGCATALGCAPSISMPSYTVLSVMSRSHRIGAPNPHAAARTALLPPWARRLKISRSGHPEFERLADNAGSVGGGADKERDRIASGGRVGA